MVRKSKHIVNLKDLSAKAQAQLSKAESNRQNRRHKKGRIKVSAPEERTVGGIIFASKLEARFYTHLKKLIPESELHLQPEFLLQDKFKDPDGKIIRSIAYRADFLLGPPRENTNDPIHPDNVVIDAKGMLTEVFKIKAKMFMHQYRGHRLWAVKNIAALNEAVASYESKKGS